jgi:cbb3-type cytochrome oxidase subunit 3
VKKRKAEFDEESNSSVQMVDDADEDDFGEARVA